MKIILRQCVCTLLLSLCYAFSALAQNPIAISGKVTSDKGEAIPGASIYVKGTTKGVITDENGTFKLADLAEKSKLVFSAVGFATQEMELANQTIFDIVLKEDSKALNEVVVTALGIKREEKSLGFAAQTISGDAVVDAKSNNWVNTLSGKVAGLNIQGVGAGPKFNGQSYFQYNPDSPTGKPTERTPWVVYEDYISSYFQTGKTYSNSLSFEGGTDNGSARLSLTHLKNEWVIPNTGFERLNAWFEKRRTGYPVLPRGTGIPVESKFPSRVPYPTYLQSQNAKNLATAVASMGGDMM
jgi:hypothetical protein